MTNVMRATGALGAATALAVMLAGCGMSDSTRVGATSQAPSLPPVQSSAVATTALPPPPGSTALAQPPAGAVAPGLSGTPVLGGAPPVQTAAVPQPNAGALPTTLADPAMAPVAGRDLSGGLTVEKLLGGWTLASGTVICRLNLTYTAKEGTSRYRASTPGCQLPALASIASWQLNGNQVQLFDEAGAQTAVLILSGNRFIGTGAGGIAISMTA